MRSQSDTTRTASAFSRIVIPIAVLVLVVLVFNGRLSGAGEAEIQAEVDDVTAMESDAGFTRTDALIASVTIFVLSIFVGFELITKVPPTLHTPLMSGSNAISGITVVGALLATGFSGSNTARVLGALAVLMATINVVGGFMVTHRMLSMFKRR